MEHVAKNFAMNLAKKKLRKSAFIVVRFLPLVIDHNHGYKSLPR